MCRDLAGKLRVNLRFFALHLGGIFYQSRASTGLIKVICVTGSVISHIEAAFPHRRHLASCVMQPHLRDEATFLREANSPAILAALSCVKSPLLITLRFGCYFFLAQGARLLKVTRSGESVDVS